MPPAPGARSAASQRAQARAASDGFLMSNATSKHFLGTPQRSWMTGSISVAATSPPTKPGRTLPSESQSQGRQEIRSLNAQNIAQGSCSEATVVNTSTEQLGVSVVSVGQTPVAENRFDATRYRPNNDGLQEVSVQMITGNDQAVAVQNTGSTAVPEHIDYGPGPRSGTTLTSLVAQPGIQTAQVLASEQWQSLLGQGTIRFSANQPAPTTISTAPAMSQSQQSARYSTEHVPSQNSSAVATSPSPTCTSMSLVSPVTSTSSRPVSRRRSNDSQDSQFRKRQRSFGSRTIQVLTPTDSPTPPANPLLQSLQNSVGRLKRQQLLNIAEEQRLLFLTEACESQDEFYLYLHQLYCVWSGSEYMLRLVGFEEPEFAGLSTLELILLANRSLSGALMGVFTKFPYQDAQLLNPGALPIANSVRCFLITLGAHWARLREECLLRKYPPCTQELELRLSLTSQMMQRIVFNSLHRQVGGVAELASVSDVQWHDSAMALFEIDQRQFMQRKANPLTMSPISELENSRLFGAEYLMRRRHFQHGQTPTISTMPSAYVVRTSISPEQISMPPLSNDFDNHNPGYLVNCGTAFVLPLHKIPYQSESQGTPVISHMMPPQAQCFRHSVPSHTIAAQPHYQARPITFDTRPSHGQYHSQYPGRPITSHTVPSRSQYQGSPASSQTLPLHSHHQGTRAPRQVELMLPYPTQQIQQSVAQLDQPPSISTSSMLQSRRISKYANALVNPYSAPYPNAVSFRPPQICQTQLTTRLETDQMAMHRAHLRGLKYQKVDTADSNASSIRLYQFPTEFALDPQLINQHSMCSEWRFHVSQESFVRLPDDLPPTDGSSARVLRLLADGTLLYRLKCVSRELSSSDVIEASEFDALQMGWPVCCFMTVNGHAVMEQGRISHHGRDCSSDLPRILQLGENVISTAIFWAPGEKKKKFFFAVELIEVRNHANVTSLVGHVSAEESLKSVTAALDSSKDDDDDLVVVDPFVSIDVIDPFMATIWRTPVRGKTCPHRECFDLEAFLQSRTSLQKNGPTNPDEWGCPICKRDARPQSLVIDEFLLQVRQQLETSGQLNAKAIRVKQDGTWEAKLDIPECDNDNSAGSTKDRMPEMPGDTQTPGIDTSSISPPRKKLNTQPTTIIELDD